MGRRLGLRLALAVSLLTLISGGYIAAAASGRSALAVPADVSEASTTSTTSSTSTPATTNTATTGSLFGCTSSVAPISLLGINVPVGQSNGQANAAGTPCVDASSTLGNTGLTLGSTELGSVGPAGSYTFVAGAPQSADPPAAAALAEVSAVNSTSAAGTTAEIVGPVQAAAAYKCVNNSLVAYGQSTLDVINIDGQNQTLPTPGAEKVFNLGGGTTVTVNEQIKTATSLTENVLDIHIGLLNTNLIVGHAEVTQSVANPCANTAPLTGTSTTTTTSQYISSPECNDGTLLDTKTNDCVLVTSSGQVIYVSAAGKSPTGGTVISLAAAKAKYKSACLSGSGPNWVLVITKKGAHATGTPGPDRIIGVADDNWANGLSGNDCIDLQGGGSSVHVDDANGNDRDYALKGNVRMVIGNGTDYIDAENSGGWLTIGNGNDRVFGGNAGSRIDLGRGDKNLKTGKGFSRVYYVGSTANISCGSPTDVLYLRSGVRKYAIDHGCTAKLTHQL